MPRKPPGIKDSNQKRPCHIDLIRGNLPDTQILLLSTLPCVESLRDYHHVLGIRCNDLVKMIYIQYQELILDNKTTLINVFDEFIDENNVRPQ